MHPCFASWSRVAPPAPPPAAAPPSAARGVLLFLLLLPIMTNGRSWPEGPTSHGQTEWGRRVIWWWVIIPDIISWQADVTVQIVLNYFKPLLYNLIRSYSHDQTFGKTIQGAQENQNNDIFVLFARKWCAVVETKDGGQRTEVLIGILNRIWSLRQVLRIVATFCQFVFATFLKLLQFCAFLQHLTIFCNFAHWCNIWQLFSP